MRVIESRRERNKRRMRERKEEIMKIPEQINREKITLSEIYIGRDRNRKKLKN